MPRSTLPAAGQSQPRGLSLMSPVFPSPRQMEWSDYVRVEARLQSWMLNVVSEPCVEKCWESLKVHCQMIVHKKALRDNRIELVRASWKELTISISDVTLSDEGQYTCSLFTMPVKTSKAFLTVLGVPAKPEITGLSRPAQEGEDVTLTCTTSGSKPAANIRWFRNDKEVQGQKEVNATGRSFTVRSNVRLKVDRKDDGAAYTCVVEHIALGSLPHQVTEVLEVHYPPQVQIVHSVIVPQEGQYFKLECVSKGNPLPEPVLWTKDGGELPDVERMIVEGRDLIITTLNKTDNGTYRCEASNQLGTNRDEFTLYVYGVMYSLIVPSSRSEQTRHPLATLSPRVLL
ncbi:Cell adhesion molecule 2 [Anabarilius grahami]|uniref:Cell adhesion molecule 2 n=1 Tax=Anabarilius grahami TaxID=495550 RepID=A0A3N0YUT2_ANAGA|nr:Cell adhesion molecule 2 [Anabarilius grahami]